MPCGIDTRGNGIVTLHIDFRNLAIVHNHSTTIRKAHVEEHVVGLVVLVAVTVDALAYLTVVHGNLVVENLRFFERGEVTLGDFHEGPGDIRGFDEAVRDIIIDGLLGYTDFKGVERQPFAPLLPPNLNFETLAFCRVEHLAPFLFGNLNLYATAVGLLLPIRCGDTSHTCLVVIRREHEVERCNIVGHGDIAIVRIDGWQSLGLLAGSRHIGVIRTRRQQ